MSFFIIILNGYFLAFCSLLMFLALTVSCRVRGYNVQQMSTATIKPQTLQLYDNSLTIQLPGKSEKWGCRGWDGLWRRIYIRNVWFVC